MRGMREGAQPELGPIAGYEFQDIREELVLSGRFHRDLGPAPVGQEPRAVAVAFGETGLVEQRIRLFDVETRVVDA